MSSVASTVNSSPVPTVAASTVPQSMPPGAISQAVGGNSAVSLVNPGTVSVNTSVSSSPNNSVLNKQRLQELVREVDPNEQLDEDVEELLLQVADDFIENVVSASCLVAKHRKSNILEVKDVQLILEKHWNMWIPGFGSEELKPYKKSVATEAHKQRMSLIRKTLKK